MTIRRDLEYAYPGDDLSRAFTATLTSGSQEVGYEPVRLTNDDPSYPFRASTTTFRLLWDFGTATRVQHVTLIHHNFLAALAGVTLAMGSSTATTDFSRTFTIRPYQENDFPQNESLDLRDVDPSYRYLSLALTSANSVAAALGKIAILSTVRTLDGTLMIDAEDDEAHPVVSHKTDIGVETIYAHGTRLRTMTGDKLQAATDAAAIRSWNRASRGRSLPFMLIPHIGEDSAAGTDEETWLVRWTEDSLPRTYLVPDLALSKYVLKFSEVSRGLRPTPSAV